MRPSRTRSSSEPPAGSSRLRHGALVLQPLGPALPAAGTQGGQPPVQGLPPAALGAVAVVPPRDWRSRHPVVSVSLNSAVRDALGQGMGRTLGAVVLAGIQSAVHDPDPEVQASRERMLAFAGAGVAMLASGVAGTYTGNMLSLTVHRRDPQAEQHSPLWMLGLLPPALLASGLAADASFGGRSALALGAGQALSRVVQYLGRDMTGQGYTAAMQYRRLGHSPGFRLRVLQADGRLLADADPDGFNRFTTGRLKVATVIYGLMCVACFALGLWMQEHRFKQEPGDHSFEGYLRGSLGMVLATVLLETLDGINGVTAHQIQAQRQGLRLELNEEETRVDNLPEFVMTHALARTATNGLQDLASALDRGLNTGPEFSAAWFAVRILPRTLAQVATEPRGFLANTSIDVLQARSREALARHDAKAQGRPGPVGPAPGRPAPGPLVVPRHPAAAPPPAGTAARPRQQAWGPSPGAAVPGVDRPALPARQARPPSQTDEVTTTSSSGTPGSQRQDWPEALPPSRLEIHPSHGPSPTESKYR